MKDSLWFPGKKPIFYIGLLFFAVLFYWASVFYLERMCCADSAFFAFRIIQEGTYDFELGRWGSVFSQTIPLLAVKLGASLPTFLKLYSLSFIGVYFLIFLLLFFFFKDESAGLGLMLYLCLGFRETFFFPVAELLSGGAVAFLVWPVIKRLALPETSRNGKVILWITFAFLLCLCSYFHQLTVFPILFIILVEFLLSKKSNYAVYLSLLLVTVIWFFIRIKLLTHSAYESGKIPGFAVFIKHLVQLRNLPSTPYFTKLFLHPLWPLTILYFLSIFHLFFSKKFLAALLGLLFIPGYVILVLVSNFNGDAPMCLETYVVIVGLLVAVLFITAFKEFMSRKVFLLGLVVILFINLKKMYETHYLFSERINYYKHLAAFAKEKPNKKFLLHERNFQWAICQSTWPLPFETLLTSSLTSPDSASTFYLLHEHENLDTLINKNPIFLGPESAVTWFMWGQNPNYFRLPQSGYVDANTEQKDTSFTHCDKSNVFIQPLRSFMKVPANQEFIYIPVKIINKSGKVLASEPDHKTDTRLSYHIYDLDGKVIIQNGIKTLLDVDIEKEYTQELSVENTLKHGYYIVEIDLLTEGKRWWGINSRVEIVIPNFENLRITGFLNRP